MDKKSLTTEHPVGRVGSQGPALRNGVVRKGGLEPPCLAAPPPQDGVSANSTTSARRAKIAQRQGHYNKIFHGLILHDGGKGFWIQTGAADQGPVDFFF